MNYIILYISIPKTPPQKDQKEDSSWQGISVSSSWGSFHSLLGSSSRWIARQIENLQILGGSVLCCNQELCSSGNHRKIGERRWTSSWCYHMHSYQPWTCRAGCPGENFETSWDTKMLYGFLGCTTFHFHSQQTNLGCKTDHIILFKSELPANFVKIVNTLICFRK